MPLWILNPGPASDRTWSMLDHDLVGIGWGELPDLAPIADREMLLAHYRRCFPDARGARMVRDVGQIDAFAHHARRGDLVLVPLRFATPVAIGEITGDYAHRVDPAAPFAHTRPVRWLTTDVAVGELDAELRQALETPLAFCRVQRRGVEEDLRRSLEERGAESRARTSTVDGLAKEEILARIEERYGPSRAPLLVNTILELRGLLRRERDESIERPGEARFVSAGDPSVVRLHVAFGPMDAPAEAEAIRELGDRVRRTHAEQGLFVAWRGVAGDQGSNPSVHVWTRDDVLEATLAVYERLPRALQGEIPLKRIWTLA